MKLLLSCLVVVVIVGVSSSDKLENNELSVRLNTTDKLGADDWDKTKDELIKSNDLKVAHPKNLKEIKKLAQDDRIELKRMKARARQLKQEMANSMDSKTEMKALKKEFKKLKKNLSSKKADLSGLKEEMKEKKLAKKDKQGKGSRNNFKTHSKKGEEKASEDLLFMIQNKQLNLIQPSTAKPDTSTADVVTMKLGRSKSRKNKKKGDKKAKNKGDDLLNMVQSDQPQQHDVELVHKISCNTDADCESGESCIANKRGHKHCKSLHGTNKPAGKKCHSSQQCAGGLQCFVTLTNEQQHHKKHPRRGKGICADPGTTDTSKGKFLPLKEKVKQ
ncbi:nucleolar protein 58-like isoform X2 [Watersipora subatra]|uniref:nucleolar protein 58-like isoform X2 n=1 Tax=Watersipora subatra TaxID=2589382 RepID=UPI00355B7C17